VFPITLPPLRQRQEDLPLLADFFLKRFGEKYHSPAKTLSPEALQAMRRYSWPGNIRELENTLERGIILCQGAALSPAELPPNSSAWPGNRNKRPSRKSPPLPEWEKEFIFHTLEKHAWMRPRRCKSLWRS
jgi:DNA-binding NtrC family response regulator